MHRDNFVLFTILPMEINILNNNSEERYFDPYLKIYTFTQLFGFCSHLAAVNQNDSAGVSYSLMHQLHRA